MVLLGLHVWTHRIHGKEAASVAALWPPLHLLIIATGSLASPLAPLAAGWVGVFSRRAPPKSLLPAAAIVAVLGIVADSVDGTLPAWTLVLRWVLLIAVGAGLASLVAGGSAARPRGKTAPVEPADPQPRRAGGEATDSEAVETALATVMRATDAHEAALWRAEGEGEERTAALLSRVAAPDVDVPESPVALAGHPFAWAIDERLPQRIEKGKRSLPSPWAAEMLLVPVEVDQRVMVLALAYPGMVPPGAETAAARSGHHLGTLLGLLRARQAVRRAEAGMRAVADAVRVLPGELELDKFAAQLAAAIRQGTGAAGAGVAMVTDESGRGKVLHVSGDSIPMDAEGFGEGESRLALAVKHGVELHHADLRRERDRMPLLTAAERWETPPRSAALLPLMLDGRAMGAVAVWHPEPGRLGEREMEIARMLCSVAPLPMRSARRFEALDQRASTDPLTGLPNRSTFDARLASLSGYYDRYARPFSVVALDVDFFKKFNDTWGHEAGDRVLQHVAELLKATVRDVDLPARLGGEEFVVLLPETTLGQAAEAAERIRRTLETRAVLWNGQRLSVTASLGVSACPDCTATPAEVMGQADAALYRAKDAGRNCVAVAPRLEKPVGAEP
ncbi:MAG TPA: sensor domain-containing diguanylate cyclase [Longimicrobium sp.]|uniref:GGDEF domain-containing protein n=1 Tax=Longimicrobium sp. TaxID=2029185 RepID=UPI002ED99D52